MLEDLVRDSNTTQDLVIEVVFIIRRGTNSTIFSQKSKSHFDPYDFFTPSIHHD